MAKLVYLHMHTGGLPTRGGLLDQKGMGVEELEEERKELLRQEEQWWARLGAMRKSDEEDRQFGAERQK